MQFVDLDGLQLAGQGQARCQWKRLEGNRFSAAADFDAQNFELVSGNRRPWKRRKSPPSFALPRTSASHQERSNRSRWTPALDKNGCKSNYSPQLPIHWLALGRCESTGRRSSRLATVG